MSENNMNVVPIDINGRIQQKNLKVTKSNVLINSRYDLTLTEFRLLKSCIAKINSTEAIAPAKIKVYASEYQKTFDCANPYAELKEASDRLFEREISYYDEAIGKRVRVRWVQSVEYQDGEGSIALEFTNMVKTHLIDLSHNFTSYQLRHISKFKSKYSIRFYELLYQYKKIGKRSFEVSELRNLFELKTKYSTFSDFRKFVLNRAIAEINKHSDLVIESKLIKKGRTITSIKFSIQSKPQKELDLN